MKKVLRRRPSAAMVIAIVALVAALAGTAVAGGGFLTKKKFNKFKSNAVQRLTYVTSTVSVPDSSSFPGNLFQVSASCPAGLHPVGGGVNLTPNDSALWWDDGYLTSTGYAAGIYNGSPVSGATATVTVACVAGNPTGSPPAG